MSGDAFKDRERAFEADWANAHDAELIEKLRERARLDVITKALARKLEADEPEMLHRVMELGVTLDTGPAFLLAPLVQIAWAGGKVTDREREAVLRVAAERGIQQGSPAYLQLLEWLHKRPSDALFDTAIEAIKTGLAVLPQAERDERIGRFAKACHQVAEASGGGLWRVLGLSSGVSAEEHEILNHIRAGLRG
jgi:hypothetical protein